MIFYDFYCFRCGRCSNIAIAAFKLNTDTVDKYDYHGFTSSRDLLIPISR